MPVEGVYIFRILLRLFFCMGAMAAAIYAAFGGYILSAYICLAAVCVFAYDGSEITTEFLEYRFFKWEAITEDRQG